MRRRKIPELNTILNKNIGFKGSYILDNVLIRAAFKTKVLLSETKPRYILS